VLRQHFKPYTAQNYEQLRSLIGGEHVSKISGPSGTEYHFEVYASLVNEDSDDIEVEGIVTEVKGRWWLPPSVARASSSHLTDRNIPGALGCCLTPNGHLHRTAAPPSRRPIRESPVGRHW
jgi:hypothetical protein